MSIAKQLHAMARLRADKPPGIDLEFYDGRDRQRPVDPETPETKPEPAPRRRGEQLTMFD